jgi:hypothetical protein
MNNTDGAWRKIFGGNLRSGHTIQHTNEIREVVDDGQVVLDYNDEVAGIQQGAYDAADGL